LIYSDNLLSVNGEAPYGIHLEMNFNQANKHRLCIAPMMDYTDRHGRYFLRQITRNALLYSEMITAGAVNQGERQKLLEFNDKEHPVALQLGGCDASELAKAAKIGELIGYDEINLNVGCPSERVKRGRFGVCLMKEPDLVAQIIEQIHAAVNIPVTVKCRIGVEKYESLESLCEFVRKVKEVGASCVAVHARVAILEGFSPKQNRTIPPLNYPRVYTLKKKFRNLEIILNGGIRNLNEVEQHLNYVDGIMIGRAAFEDPYMLAEADRRIFHDNHDIPTRHTIGRIMLPYIEDVLTKGARLHNITKHMLGLFHAKPGARQWRRYLSTNVFIPNAGPEVVEKALELVPEE